MNKIKKMVLFLLFIFIVPNNVLAITWAGGVEGAGGYVSSCMDYNY